MRREMRPPFRPRPRYPLSPEIRACVIDWPVHSVAEPIQCPCTADQKLRQRAQLVIPGGMYGHLRSDRLPEGYPQFFARGEGCHLWDVNGKRYVDFMCSWGPIVVGHGNPVVDEAVARQTAAGDCLNGPSERLVELAERLVGLIPHADWALFCKNGTDATTTCVTLARAATGKRKILVAEGAYHGAIPWCTPQPVRRHAGRSRPHADLRLQRHRQPRDRRAARRRRPGRHRRLRLQARFRQGPGDAGRGLRPARRANCATPTTRR